MRVQLKWSFEPWPRIGQHIRSTYWTQMLAYSTPPEVHLDEETTPLSRIFRPDRALTSSRDEHPLDETRCRGSSLGNS